MFFRVVFFLDYLTLELMQTIVCIRIDKVSPKNSGTPIPCTCLCIDCFYPTFSYLTVFSLFNTIPNTIVIFIFVVIVAAFWACEFTSKPIYFSHSSLFFLLCCAISLVLFEFSLSVCSESNHSRCLHYKCARSNHMIWILYAHWIFTSIC